MNVLLIVSPLEREARLARFPSILPAPAVAAGDILITATGAATEFHHEASLIEDFALPQDKCGEVEWRDVFAAEIRWPVMG